MRDRLPISPDHDEEALRLRTPLYSLCRGIKVKMYDLATPNAMSVPVPGSLRQAIIRISMRP